jgi:ribonuclease HIII
MKKKNSDPVKGSFEEYVQAFIDDPVKKVLIVGKSEAEAVETVVKVLKRGKIEYKFTDNKKNRIGLPELGKGFVFDGIR